jgi:transcription elongation factor GreA
LQLFKVSKQRITPAFSKGKTMSEQFVPMTVNGKKRLEEELKHLMTTERPNVIKAIEEARAQGDLSENAEYDAAKEKQAFIEGRIQELNSKLARSQVIDPSKLKSDKVVFGATVVLEDTSTEKQVKYQIVGVDEADAAKGLISIASPIARALIGKKEGDAITVNAPGGDREFELVKFYFE